MLVTSIFSCLNNDLKEKFCLLSHIWYVTCECFLAPLAVGQRAYVMVRCPSCDRAAVWPSVRMLTFSFNILFSETTSSDFDDISQKCFWYGPLQNLLKKFDSVKNCCCHGNKTEKNLKTLKIFLSETIRVRATKFGM